MLRPTFLGFETAKRGIQVSQKGLDITGQNMANWDSEGYTRQRIDQVAIATSAYATRFGTNRVGLAGQGVGINGVAQLRDTFLDKRFRDESADQGYFDQANLLLADIEAAIGEFNPLSNVGIRGCLETLLPALQTFSGIPFSESNANIVYTEFSNLVQTLHQLNSKLDSVESQQKYNLGTSVQEVNKIMEEIAGLNYTISQDIGLTMNNNGYYGPNELLDQRNLLLDKLSVYGDIEITQAYDYTITVKMGGKTVVDGDKHERMNMTENSNGTVSLRWSSSGEDIQTITGSLKGAADFINGRGPNVISKGETHLKGIPYYRDQLNTFANTLVNVVNSIIPDYNSSGVEIGKKMLLGAMTGAVDGNGNYIVGTGIPVTAANISMSTQWTDDRSYIIPIEDNKGNNYILDLYSALADRDSTFVSNGEVFKGTFYEFVTSYAATLAEDIVFYGGRFEASSVIVSDLQDRRDAVSGVMLDEETTNMMMYNKSFQAASRLMTTLDEALDVLINRTGLVGR